MDTDTIDFRLKITNFIKKVILVNINPLLQKFTNELNEEEDQVCSMYGNYAYLSLLDELKDNIKCNKKDDIIITDMGDDFEINCDLEKTLTDLNMLIINKNENKDDLITKCTFFLNKVINLLNEKFSDRLAFTITKSLNRELFKGIRLSLQVKSKRRSIRFGLSDLDYLLNFSHLLNIDIYTENINIRFFKEHLIETKYNIKTLSRYGYIILSSFVYYKTLTELGLRLNKIRFETILRTFTTEEDAFKCVENSNELFKDYNFTYTSRASFILKRFLIRFDKTYGRLNLPFSLLESELNHRLLTQKLFVDNTLSLREMIDSFIKETDSALQEKRLGRFLKAGGDAFQYHSQHEELLNDIDTKIFLKNTSKENKQKVCDNIVSTLFFMIDRLNYFKNEKIDIEYDFTFAGKQMKIKLQNDYLTINYSSVELVQISININTLFVVDELELKHITRSDPFDIWIYHKSINPEINKDELYINLDYFMENLKESFIDKTDKRLDRFYNSKLKKDKNRYDILLKSEKKRKLNIVNVTKNIPFIKNIINLFWTIPPGGIVDRTFISILKNNFLSYDISKNIEAYDYIKRFLPEYFDGSLPHYQKSFTIEPIFISLLLLITKLKEIEYSSYSVIIQFDPFFYEKVYYDENSMCKIKISELLYTDLVYLIWYSSNSEEHRVFNEKLRNGEELTFNENKIKTRLDYIISKGKIIGSPETPIILYRGIDMIEKDFRKENFKSKSYLSTSIDKDSARFFTNKNVKKCCLMKIIINSEIEGIYLNLIDIGIEYEKEVLLPRDLKLIYKESYIDNENYINHVYEVENPISYERKVVEQIEYKGEVADQIEEEKEIKTEESLVEEIFVEEQKTHEFTYHERMSMSEKLKFIKNYHKNNTNYTKEQLRLVIMTENRRRRKFIHFFEKEFGLFCLRYLKEHEGINYDFSTVINSTLTLERTAGNTSISIRQLLNTFVATIHHYLNSNNIGKLYKTGGEAVRYYTGDKGDMVTNDIDSKFCVNNIPEMSKEQELARIKDVRRDIFKKIATAIIFTAIMIKNLNFHIDRYELENEGTTFGYITSYNEMRSTRKVIDDYVIVRTNYVGCWGKNGIDDIDCMNIISIDINHKVVLDGLSDRFDGDTIHFYLLSAPYDFLFSNKNCEDNDIQLRKDNKNPPVVSLTFIVKDLINLLTSYDYKTSKDYLELKDNLQSIGITGDLQKRLLSKKHDKDMKRSKAIIYKHYGNDKRIKINEIEYIKELLKILKKISMQQNEYIKDENVLHLDQTCPNNTLEPCFILKNVLYRFLEMPQSTLNPLELPIISSVYIKSKTVIGKDVNELFTILADPRSYAKRIII